MKLFNIKITPPYLTAPMNFNDEMPNFIIKTYDQLLKQEIKYYDQLCRQFENFSACCGGKIQKIPNQDIKKLKPARYVRQPRLPYLQGFSIPKII